MQLRSKHLMHASPYTLAALLCVVVLAHTGGTSALAVTERVSLTDGDLQANDHSTTSLYGLSSDAGGNLIAFTSFASNLVTGDTNGSSDVFVRDLTTGSTQLISRSPLTGLSGHGISYHPAMSKNGRWVAFASSADDLVANDTNQDLDIFLYDRQTSQIARCSVSAAGDEADNLSTFPSIATTEAGDKVFISFSSRATNLVPGGSSGLTHIFHCTYDVATGDIEIAQASVGAGDLEGDESSVLSAISGNGRFVVYTTYIWNIIPPTRDKPEAPILQILVYDHFVGHTYFRLITTPDEGAFPAMSGDGRFFAYVQEGNVILYDMLEFKNETISIGTGGAASDDASGEPSISGDGRFVAFSSIAANLVPGDSNGTEDVFVRDRAIRRTERVSLTHDGQEGNGASRAPSISIDGLKVAYSSSATNIVADDTNLREDVFANDWRASLPGSQPDMLVRNSDETWYVGNGVYNDTSQDQQVDGSAERLMPAVYHLKVQNDGNTPDTFIISSAGGGEGWTVQYFDAISQGGDITATVIGPGWQVGPLAPGEYREFRVAVGLEDGVATSGPNVLPITASSAADVTNIDVVQVTTREVLLSGDPDLLIRNQGDTWYLGNDVYNATGVNQTSTQEAEWDAAAAYEIKVQNDGTANDSFVITGDAGGSGWTVTYYDDAQAGNDITMLVTSDGFNTSELIPGASVVVRLEMAVDPGVPVNTQREALVTVRSATDDMKVDAVKAVADPPAGGASSQPDLLVRNHSDASYVGNDVYNETGENQTRVQQAQFTQGVMYDVRVQNDGAVSNSFVITAGGSDDGWAVAYYTGLTAGTDITDQITGQGWTTASLAPGGYVEIRAEVTVDGAVPAGLPQEMLVSGRSSIDAAKVDAVKTVTNPAQPQAFTHTFGSGVWLTSVPAVPTTPQADAVFGTTAVAGWSAVSQAYRYFTQAAFDVTLGSGYWVNYPSGRALSVQAQERTGPVTVQVMRDWNLLGNPKPYALKWSSVNPNGPALQFGWIQNDAGTGYSLISTLTLGNAVDEVPPWRGFWLKAVEGGSVTLGAATTAEAHADAVDWAIQLQAQAAGIVDADNYIGVATTAQAIRGANPPTAGGAYVDIYAVPEQGARDAISLAGSLEPQAWNLVAETNIPDTQVRISFPDLSSAAPGKALMLIDLDAGKTVNMRTTAAYVFTSGADGAKRHLRVQVRERSGQALITSASVAPRAGALGVAYSLSAAGQVDIDILNIAGRRVGAINCGYQDQGAHTASWTGKGLAGTRVPAGQYLLTIRVSADDGTQSSRVVSAQVR